ncbi:MAG: anaerobic ribonucleoside-triphosphate reductase activating protein [Anaerocolumna sp.]
MRYHNITKDDMLNGTGLRVVLWVSGCTHACPGCQNPITWDINGGLVFDEAAKKELFQELRKDYIEGITLSGGDPLHPANLDEIGALIEEMHTTYPEKTIWLYTGFSWETIKNLAFIPLIDVIVDGRFKPDLLDTQLHWKGSSNQNVIHVKKSLSENSLILL